MIVALTPDLMDRSKVTAAAEAVGQAVRFVNRAALLVAAVSGGADVDLVVVDLGRDGALDAVRGLSGAAVRVVGFGSHVDRDLLTEAGEAGCDQVLARSQFFGRLDDLLGAAGQRG